LRTGEIPDKFTLGLVAAALAIRAVVSITNSNIDYFLDGAITGSIFFAFGAVLFYTGGWGGGDAKLVTGIGAALGGVYSSLSMVDSGFGLFPAFFGFFVAMAIVSIPYSVIYSFILSLKHKKVFTLTRESLKENSYLLIGLFVLSFALIIILKPWTAVLAFALLSPPILFMLLLYVKAVEKEALQKEIPVSQLQEGDMVLDDITYGKKKLASARDMDGLSKDALGKIQKLATSGKLPKTIRIKWGIRFAPVFVFAILITPYWTDIMKALLI
jgi:Flp pilus assembly protein protease CpaA